MTLFRPLLTLALFGVGTTGIALTPGGDAGIRALDRLFQARYAQGRPGASVLIKRGNEVLLKKAYGQASLELAVPMKPEHVFRIGSVTKTFGAVVILQLVDEGKLLLDAPLATYLKDVPKSWQKVTLAQLLSHTSGIPSYNSGPQGGYAALRSKRRTLDEVIASFRDLPLEFEPGSAFTYSNSGYLLLEKVIETATGQGFFPQLEARIIRPLGLHHTGGGNPDQHVPQLVTGYTADGRPTYPAPLDVSFMAGGMVSTTHDLATFNEALHGGRLLHPDSYRRMTTEIKTPNGEGTGYGLGLWIRNSQGHQLLGHGGDVVGFSAEVEADPSSRTLAIILQNEDKFAGKPVVDVEYLSRRALAAAAGRPIAEPRAVEVPEAQLLRLVGTYAAGPTRRIIRLEQGKLVSQVQGGRPHLLQPSSPTTFFSETSELRLRFVLEGGRAVAVQKFEDQGEQGPLGQRLPD